jgi:hypothetical protein
MAELLLASRRCSQCLTTRNRIVSGERAAEIIRECRRKGIHFICHKGTATNQIIHCRGVHEIVGGSKAHYMAQALRIPIREVDPDTLD